MIIAYIALLIIFVLCPPISICDNTQATNIYNDYLQQNRILPIKGLFTCIVMLSHFRGYVVLPNDWLNNTFVYLTDCIGQLMVAIFFFYSGFGIYESIKKKRKQYINEFFKNRIFKTWVKFAICICLFYILAVIKREHYCTNDIFLAFTGWTAIGNSNWFMFDTFALYVLLYITFIFFENSLSIKPLVLFSFSSVALFIWLLCVKPDYWWNTLFCFPIGMWFSRYKSTIDDFISKSSTHYWLVLLMIIVSFCISYIKKTLWRGTVFCICSIFFCLFIVFASMKVRCNSSFLTFAGKHVFSIYILQRLVYIVFAGRIDNSYLFFTACFCTIILIAAIFDYSFENIIWRKNGIKS